MNTQDQNPETVILAGSGRSGTSWLGAILNSYEKAEYFYEITNYSELDFGQPGLIAVKYPLTGGWRSRPHWVERAERQLLGLRSKWGPNKAGAQRSLRVFADHIFEKADPDIFLYKIVTLYGFAQRREELARRFHNRLKVVHLIRNPFAQIASELRIDARNPEGSKTHFKQRVEQVLEDSALCSYHAMAREAMERGWVSQMALVWRISNEVMLRDQYLDKKLVVYEQLCREPLAVATEIFDYLGWRMGDQTVQYIRKTSEVTPAEAEYGNFSLRKNADESVNRWRSELHERDYAQAREAIESSDLMRLWSPEDLSLGAGKK